MTFVFKSIGLEEGALQLVSALPRFLLILLALDPVSDLLEGLSQASAAPIARTRRPVLKASPFRTFFRSTHCDNPPKLNKSGQASMQLYTGSAFV